MAGIKHMIVKDYSKRRALRKLLAKIEAILAEMTREGRAG